MEKISSAWPRDAVPKVKSIKVFEVELGRRLLVADESVFAVQIRNNDNDNEIIIPFLAVKPEILQRFPSVTVDMGAVKFVCNGAKVMRPGITNFDSFKKGEIVVVRDQMHGKSLAVGIALEDSESAKSMTKGYVIDNLHYISDKMWKAYKEI
ncbi:MAG TPA: PUA domain-containing protein [Nitrososphaera sp.]|nr:PUA domain-containing protein [Nitrososphaera sp.]